MAKTIVVFLGLLGWAGSAAADSITIFNDQRVVSVLAQVADSGQTDRHTDSRGPGDALSAQAVASVGTSVASSVARLTSSISDPAHLSGSGSALASFSTFGSAEASAAAVFAVDLVLDAPYITLSTARSPFPISLAGQMPRSTRPGGPRPCQAADRSCSIWAIRIRHFFRTSPGMCQRGRNHFLVETRGDGLTERPATVVEDSQFQFALDLTPAPVNPSPTPEPTSVLLLGTAVAGLVASKTKARRNGVRRVGRGK